MITEAINNLMPQIESLETEQQKRLLAEICKRQFFFYYEFCAKIGASADSFFLLLKALGTKNYSREITEEIKAFAPDTDDYAGSLAASKAVDACAILHQAYLFFDAPKSEIWKTVIELYLNVPEMIAEETGDETIFREELEILEKWVTQCISNQDFTANLAFAL